MIVTLLFVVFLPPISTAVDIFQRCFAIEWDADGCCHKIVRVDSERGWEGENIEGEGRRPSKNMSSPAKLVNHDHDMVD